MATILRMEQGTAAWHEHRRRHRNASEAATVVGVSPYMTPHQLWQLKTGRAQPEPPNAAMAWGTRMEPQARLAYEERTGLVMEPLVLVDGEYSASLDGLTLDGKLILEVKCPAKGKASALWQAVSAGEIPVHYVYQLQQQLMVSGAELAHLFVWTEDDAILLEHAPDPDSFTILRDSWDMFWHHVGTDTPPPLTDADTVVRTDEAWIAAAQQYIALSAQADEVGDELVEAKKRLLSLARHTSERGAGVAVSTYWRAGTVDLKKLVQTLGIDPEPFRGPARQETRISLTKA
jgi:putative phage-type endonuclease